MVGDGANLELEFQPLAYYAVLRFLEFALTFAHLAFAAALILAMPAAEM